MSSDVSLHVLYRIVNSPVRMFPFPHVYARDVFSREYTPPELAQPARSPTQTGAPPRFSF